MSRELHDGGFECRPIKDPATIVSVTGGANGMSATFTDIRGLADRFDQDGDSLRDWGKHSATFAADPDLVESAVLSPETAAAAEAAIFAATIGPEGLVVTSAYWEADARAIRAVARLWEEVDDHEYRALQAMDYAVGGAVGFQLGTAARVLGPAVALDLLAADRLDPGVAGRLGGELGGTVEGPAQAMVVEHPELVQHLADGGGGLIDGFGTGLLGAPVTFTPTNRDGARDLAALYGDEGHPVVRAVPGRTLPTDARQPAGVTGMMRHLQQVADLSPEPDSRLNGTIEVQTITGTDGQVRHIVYLPGTDDLGTLPWTQDHDVRDMGTNTQLMAGETDTYQRGILQAMHEAGIRPGEPVALVGHSQGGMEAAAIAAHQHAFNVTNVVTAGSPTAQVGPFPTGVHVLSLEQRGDVVPLLAGRPNPDSGQQTTVLFDAHPAPTILAHHAYPTYTEGAEAVDTSPDPSVQAQIASLHGNGFLGDGSGVQVHSLLFQVTRG